MDLVPRAPGLFPVGRLDIVTEGLILLTNDGAFAEKVSHPRYETPRVYHAKVSGVPDARALQRMREGVTVEGQRMVADDVKVLDAENNAWLEVTVHEGRHHEVRRLLQAVGHPVSKLRRVAIGPLTTHGLAIGQFRGLTPAEVAALTRPRKGPAKADHHRLARVPRRKGARGRRPPVRTDVPRTTGRRAEDSRTAAPAAPARTYGERRPAPRGTTATRGAATTRGTAPTRGTAATRGTVATRGTRTSSTGDRVRGSGPMAPRPGGPRPRRPGRPRRP
jgi:23S rRNA pseudouridine2605 synthase